MDTNTTPDSAGAMQATIVREWSHLFTVTLEGEDLGPAETLDDAREIVRRMRERYGLIPDPGTTP